MHICNPNPNPNPSSKPSYNCDPSPEPNLALATSLHIIIAVAMATSYCHPSAWPLLPIHQPILPLHYLGVHTSHISSRNVAITLTLTLKASAQAMLLRNSSALDVSYMYDGEDDTRQSTATLLIVARACMQQKRTCLNFQSGRSWSLMNTSGV